MPDMLSGGSALQSLSPLNAMTTAASFLSGRKKILSQFRSEIDQRDGKLLVSEILTAVMTSDEIEASLTWEDAEKAIRSLKLFDTAPEMDLMRLVFNQLQDRLIEIDVDFISELGFLYLNILSLSLLRNFQMP